MGTHRGLGGDEGVDPPGRRQVHSAVGDGIDVDERVKVTPLLLPQHTVLGAVRLHRVAKVAQRGHQQRQRVTRALPALFVKGLLLLVTQQSEDFHHAVEGSQVSDGE